MRFLLKPEERHLNDMRLNDNSDHDMEEYKYDVYICYSPKDYFDEQGNVIPDNEVSKILQALDDAGISYWIDKEGIDCGDKNTERLFQSIQASRIVLFLSSHNSNYNSNWTAREIAFACEWKKCIIPVRVDPSKYSEKILLRIADLKYINYHENPKKGLVYIIDAIKKELEVIKKNKESELSRKELECEEIRRGDEKHMLREEIERSREENKMILREIENAKKRQEEITKREEELRRRLQQLENSQHSGEILSPQTGSSPDTPPTESMPSATPPQEKEKSRSIIYTIGSTVCGSAALAIVGGIVGGVVGVVSGASYIGKKIKTISDSTQVSYSIPNVYQNANDVLSSVFAPAEVKRASHMLVQVYLHLPKESETVQAFAQETDKNARRRDYIPLQCKLTKGDKVDVLLNIYGETLMMSERKSVVWQGSFTKCSFDFLVPKDINVDELSCMAMLSVNGTPVGEMRFITTVVEKPRQLNPEIFSKQYQKIFISYAHQDEPKVEQMARAYKAQGVEYFFDRHYLQPGDIFPIKIREFIDSADLFILCWSANAANSDYVDLERKRALERAYPKIKPIEKAPLRIYPMSIEPRAELPADMRDTYNFEII